MNDPSPATTVGAPQEYAIKTWRYLRLAMIALVVGLATAVVYEIVRGGGDCVQRSISAYYYTHAQAVFVGALVAVGACLICLRGSTDHEDVILNVAGMLAPVVAFVPTTQAGPCASLPGLPQDPRPNIENNVTALLVIGLAGLVLLAVLAAMAWADPKATRPTPTALGGYGVAVVLWAGGGVLFLAKRTWFVQHAHMWAAVPMFACIIAVAVVNAFSFKRKQGDPNAKNRYLALGVLMPVIVIALALFGGTYRVLEAEVAAILLFAIFWAIQTQELWHEGLRPGAAPGAAADVQQ